jgi:hypothetical protein
MPIHRFNCSSCGIEFIVIMRGGGQLKNPICSSCQIARNTIKSKNAEETVERDVTDYEKVQTKGADAPNCCANCKHWKGTKGTNRFWKECDMGFASDEDCEEPMGLTYLLDRCGKHER